MLELPRGGKIRAQDAAVARSAADVVAFSDANALWEPGALRALVAPFADPDVAYVCGQVRFVNDGGTNQEGLYWRYEMAIAPRSRAGQRDRRQRRDLRDPPRGLRGRRRRDGPRPELPLHDGQARPARRVRPAARATEKMVPSIEGEFARKRRMMSHMWPIVVRGGLLSPRGYPLRYAWMIASHRVLRYAAPFLHVAALGLNLALLGEGRSTR